MIIVTSPARNAPLFVRINDRLAQFEAKADAEYWDNLWLQMPRQLFEHTMRTTKWMGRRGDFFLKWLPKGEIVLEAGCGTGYWVQRLGLNNVHCVGIDYTSGSLLRSKEFRPHLPLINGDAFKLPFEDGSLGAYLSLGVVEHYREGPDALLQECARVLKPGGVALISVPYLNQYRKHINTVSEETAIATGHAFFQYFYSQADMHQRLTVAGLSPRRIFFGDSANLALIEAMPSLAPLIKALGSGASLLDYIPGLTRLMSHMMYTVSEKA